MVFFSSLTRRSRACQVAVFLLLGLSGPAAAAPQVVVSIPPLHGLASAVMAGIGEPHLLLAAGVSPHNWSMRPSQARALNRADLIVWVGPDLERSLDRTFRASKHQQAWMSMMALPGLELLPRRVATGHDEHGGGDQHEADDSHDDHEHHDDADHAAEPRHDEPAGHEHGGDDDPHVWLDPDNAIVFVQALAQRLALLSPADSERFAANARTVTEDIEKLKATLKAQAQQLRGERHAVYHDAYQYLEHFLGLPAPIAVTVDPDQPRGARQVSRLEEQLRESGVRCLYAEPQFDGALVRNLAGRLMLQVGVLDPLGSTIEPGPSAYPALMNGLLETMLQCTRTAQ